MSYAQLKKSWRIDMTREEAKILLPIIQAYADGKTIESRCIKGDKSLWYDDEDPSFDDDFEYRLKSEPRFRPFKDAEECWNEMQKHQPFGWVKRNGYYYNIVSTDITSVRIINNKGAIIIVSFSNLLSSYTFVDGTLFGIKDEEQLWKLMKKQMK